MFQSKVGERLLARQAIILIAAMAFLLFARLPLIPDLGWLIEASRRWIAGGELYRDIIEVNPPLVFYLTVALSGGTLNAAAYLAGVCAAIALSCLWVLRLRGPYLALASVAAMIVGGLTDFGQRDQLALIFAIPLLLGDKAGTGERIALGAWAFVGVGLKPYFLLIPAAAVTAKAIADRSLQPLFSAEVVTLGVASVAYLASIALLHPAYFTEILPLASFVYWAIDAEPNPTYVVLSAVIIALSAIPLLTGDREKLPLSAAVLAALLAFYLQGRWWPYHFVPAMGLALLLAAWLARESRSAGALFLLLCLVQAVRGPYRWEPPYIIPQQLRSMAVLSADVWPAYPAGLRVRNTTRYPSLWTIPGALQISRDPTRPAADRRRAARILQNQRSIIRGDIVHQRPQAILADTRNLDFMRLIGPFEGYRYAGRRWIYDVWVREPDTGDEAITRARPN